MARPKAGVLFAVDGITYRTSKDAAIDYLISRLSGKPHAESLATLEKKSALIIPLFNIPASATPEHLSKALEIVLRGGKE